MRKAQYNEETDSLPACPEASRSVLRVVSVVEGIRDEDVVSSMVPGTVAGLSTKSISKSGRNTPYQTRGRTQASHGTLMSTGE